MELKQLKSDYEKFVKKYKLPNFEKLNKNFEIEKISYESDCLLRAVRKAMLDKVFNLLSFLEMLLNPVNLPRMYLPYVKQISSNDKRLIEKIYGELSELSMKALVLEVEYEEKKEAELVNSLYNKWSELKPDLRELMGSIGKPVDNFVKKEKTYFG